MMTAETFTWTWILCAAPFALLGLAAIVFRLFFILKSRKAP